MTKNTKTPKIPKTWDFNPLILGVIGGVSRIPKQKFFLKFAIIFLPSLWLIKIINIICVGGFPTYISRKLTSSLSGPAEHFQFKWGQAVGLICPSPSLPNDSTWRVIMYLLIQKLSGEIIACSLAGLGGPYGGNLKGVICPLTRIGLMYLTKLSVDKSQLP